AEADTAAALDVLLQDPVATPAIGLAEVMPRALVALGDLDEGQRPGGLAVGDDALEDELGATGGEQRESADQKPRRESRRFLQPRATGPRLAAWVLIMSRCTWHRCCGPPSGRACL